MAYIRRDVTRPRIWLSWRRQSPTGQVPLLVLDDGEQVTDSTAIAHRIERDWPAPAALPTDPALRARCDLLEDWADESLYFHAGALRWFDPRGLADASRGLAPGLKHYVARNNRARLLAQGIGRKPLTVVEDDVRRLLAALSAELGDAPWLLGDTPYLCDFAVGAQLVYLARTPRGGELVAEWPVLGAYLDRFRDLRTTPTGTRARPPAAPGAVAHDAPT